MVGVQLARQGDRCLGVASSPSRRQAAREKGSRPRTVPAARPPGRTSGPARLCPPASGTGPASRRRRPLRAAWRRPVSASLPPLRARRAGHRSWPGRGSSTKRRGSISTNRRRTTRSSAVISGRLVQRGQGPAAVGVAGIQSHRAEQQPLRLQEILLPRIHRGGLTQRHHGRPASLGRREDLVPFLGVQRLARLQPLNSSRYLPPPPACPAEHTRCPRRNTCLAVFAPRSIALRRLASASADFRLSVVPARARASRKTTAVRARGLSGWRLRPLALAQLCQSDPQVVVDVGRRTAGINRLLQRLWPPTPTPPVHGNRSQVDIVPHIFGVQLDAFSP